MSEKTDTLFSLVRLGFRAYYNEAKSGGPEKAVHLVRSYCLVLGASLGSSHLATVGNGRLKLLDKRCWNSKCKK